MHRGRSVFGALLVAVASIHCSAKTLPHTYDPSKARDYAAPRGDLPSVVLLVPSNTLVYRPTLEIDPPESYSGPARVFLSPGGRNYTIVVDTAEGVMKLKFDAWFEAGKRYELRIIETGDNVAYELFELHPSSYAAIYPDG